jgi:CelD/BcsL family acetyltransferase involved in cellulose biosynthesis
MWLPWRRLQFGRTGFVDAVHGPWIDGLLADALWTAPAALNERGYISVRIETPKEGGVEWA